jgi:hypothetical protein
MSKKKKLTVNVSKTTTNMLFDMQINDKILSEDQNFLQKIEFKILQQTNKKKKRSTLTLSRSCVSLWFFSK